MQAELALHLLSACTLGYPLTVDSNWAFPFVSKVKMEVCNDEGRLETDSDCESLTRKTPQQRCVTPPRRLFSQRFSVRLQAGQKATKQ